MGSVTDVVRRYAPASYRALCGVTNDYYSLDDLQSLADFVQFRLYATVPGAENEAWEDPRKTQLLGILTTLQFIPAAVDFWGDQLASESGSSGAQNESRGFFDRREELWKLFAKLQEQAAELATEVGVPALTMKTVVPKVSYGDNGRGILKTEDPYDFPSLSGLCFPWSYWR